MRQRDKNQVSTPTHIAGFLCQAIGVDHTTRVFDGTCGDGALLIQALTLALEHCRNRDVDTKEKQKIADEIANNLIWGIEVDKEICRQAQSNLQTVCGESCNLLCGNLFEQETFVRQADPDIILMNPPFNTPESAIPNKYKTGWRPTDKEDPTKGMVFLQYISDIIKEMNDERIAQGLPKKEVKTAFVLPMACAIGTGDVLTDVKTHLLEDNTLDAVFSLPDELFYPYASAHICCMVFTLGRPHISLDGTLPMTFFGYYKDDGHQKKQKYGRVELFDADGNSKWKTVKKEWIDLYVNSVVRDGMSSIHAVSGQDEWLCEAYMCTSYENVKTEDFQETLNEYVSFLVKNKYYPNLRDNLSHPLELRCNEWKEFHFGNLLSSIKKARPIIKEKLIEATVNQDKIRYVTRISDNNGCEMLASLDGIPFNKIEKGNAISIGDTTANGFYQDDDFICGHHMYVARSDWMNRCTALFVVTLLKKERYKYSYGRSIRVECIKNTCIKLPVDSEGKPDWRFIEHFMRSLRYGNNL